MMQSYFPSTVIQFTILVLLHMPISLCQDDQFKRCGEPSTCGGIPINYPFWGGTRPEYCGHPTSNFEIKCELDIPNIDIESTTYKVLMINDTTRLLTLARDDLLSDICLENPKSASLDNHFNYVTSDQNITVYFGCTLHSGSIPTAPNVFPCKEKKPFSAYSALRRSNTYDVFTTISLNFSGIRCESEIIARVNQTNAFALATRASLEVLKTAISGGFSVQWIENIGSTCERCVSSGGICGSNQDAEAFACHCETGTHPNDCNVGGPRTGNVVAGPRTGNVVAGPRTGNVVAGPRKRLSMKLAIVGSVVITVLLSVSVIYYLRRQRSCPKQLICWKTETEDRNIEEFMRTYGSLAPKLHNYSDLKRMTNSFSHKIGQGGFGQVYKGKLPDGRDVAVKVLTNTNGDGEEYVNEVASISRTSHVNIVGLLGFCYQRNQRALIYEYVSNGSLDKFLNNGPSGTTRPLEWTTLYKIAVGIGRGLEYLHRGCNTRIVHFDIKPHNILLDEDFCPKISDFGLSKLCERKQSILSMLGARGTAGYIAPEVFSRAFGQVSHKSDVYSYGMLVLEMVGVRNNVQVTQTSEVYFPHWIYEHLELGKELSLQGIMNEDDEEMARKMILVGLWCIQTKPSDRPAIEKAVEMLEGSIHSIQIAPKPVLFSPTKSIPDSFVSTSTTT